MTVSTQIAHVYHGDKADAMNSFNIFWFVAQKSVSFRGVYYSPKPIAFLTQYPTISRAIFGDDQVLLGCTLLVNRTMNVFDAANYNQLLQPSPKRKLIRRSMTMLVPVNPVCPAVWRLCIGPEK